MEEKIREIVATFIKIPADQIGPATPVDRAAVKSSILLHRMYARLAEQGFVVGNYASVRVFGDLVRQGAAAGGDGGPGTEAGDGTVAQNGGGAEGSAIVGGDYPAAMTQNGGGAMAADGGEGGPLSLGVDIEAIDSLPRATDFRREEFYKMNFTPREIAYCILQADPYSSFAGLFAAKEALVKADAALRERPFNQLGIGHSPEGKPLYPGFALSISHAHGTAVAVAARGGNPGGSAALTAPSASPAGGASSGGRIAWLALLLAAAA